MEILIFTIAAIGVVTFAVVGLYLMGYKKTPQS
jgi:hypothetical protein